MNLRNLSDSEFLRYANSQVDDLTSTAIELELLRRLEATDTDAFDAAKELEFSGNDLRQLSEAFEGFTTTEVIELFGVIGKYSLAVGPLIEILRLLEKAGITEADELKEALEFAGKFRAIANDAGDVFTRLTTLISETQE